MKGLERRLLKLESGMSRPDTPLESLSDEELVLRISGMIKRGSGAKLSPQEEAALATPLKGSRPTARMTDEELNTQLSNGLAGWFSERGNKAQMS